MRWGGVYQLTQHKDMLKCYLRPLSAATYISHTPIALTSYQAQHAC